MHRTSLMRFHFSRCSPTTIIVKRNLRIIPKDKLEHGIELDDEQEIAVELQVITKLICYKIPKIVHINLRTFWGGWRDLNEIEVESISLQPHSIGIHKSNCCFMNKKRENEYYCIKMTLNETLDNFKEFLRVF
eukprot:gene12550-6370_t